MTLIDTTAAVDTPERVRFRYRLAGPGQRAAAWALDVGVQFLLTLVLAAALTALRLVPGMQGVGAGLLLVGLFALQWLYGAVCETLWSGQTPGKMVLGLRVVRDDGAPARLPDFLLRNLLRAVDALPVAFLLLPTFGLAAVVMAADRRQRRLGDVVAGTVVVSEESARVLGTVEVDPPITEEERQALPPGVVLSNQELQVVEAFLRRRRRLSPARAEELARFFAPVLREREQVHAEADSRVLALAYARATGRDREGTPERAP